MSNFDNQLSRMKSLITYGKVNESTRNNNSSLECHKEGADGKVYGIIRECHKFYIKTTTKDKATIAESYDYIGGWNNHKDYEYNDLRTAEKQLDFKLQSINEAYGVESSINREDNNVLMTEGTESMKNELHRQREIMRNAARIINEGSSVCVGDPERVSGNNDPQKPFTEKATAKLDKDLKDKESDPSKACEPFGDDAKEEKPTDAKIDGSVASAQPAGGKVSRDGAVKVNESCENGVCDDDDEFAPEDIDVDEDDITIDADDEDVDVDVEADEINNDEDSDDVDVDDDTETIDIESDTDEDDDVDYEEKLDELQADIDELRAKIADMEGADVEDDFDEEDEEFDSDDTVEDEDEADDVDDEEDEEFDEDEDEFDDFDEEDEEFDDLSESKKQYLKTIAESVARKILDENVTVLHDFGKHPGYRKKPMTTHPSETNDEPFGTKIGDTKPFEKAVSVITDQIVDTIKKKIQ